MPRIAPLDLSQAAPATAETLAAVRQKIGMVPNLFATLAHSPAALHGYLGLSDTLAGGGFSAAQREVVALAVAQANACDYCLAAHTKIGKGAGLEPAAIQAARKGEGTTPADAALARFARQLAESRGTIGDGEFAAFKSAGFDDAAAMETVALVALNTLTNYANHLAGTDVDFPRVHPDPDAV